MNRPPATPAEAFAAGALYLVSDAADVEPIPAPPRRRSVTPRAATVAELIAAIAHARRRRALPRRTP
jgi:hypothetical protein